MAAVLVSILLALVWLALMWALWLRPLRGTGRYTRDTYDEVGRTRVRTVFLILLAGWIGGAYYLLRIRPGLVAYQSPAQSTPAAVATTLPAPTSQPVAGFAPAAAKLPASASPSRESRTSDRELIVRNIPPDMVAVKTIPPGSEFPPLPFARDDVVAAVLEFDGNAEVSQSHRINLANPGLTLAITFPLEDPLPQVMLRIGSGSDRKVADEFISHLLSRLGAPAFDTTSPTLIFSPRP